MSPRLWDLASRTDSKLITAIEGVVRWTTFDQGGLLSFGTQAPETPPRARVELGHRDMETSSLSMYCGKSSISVPALATL
jgi:hypothetical protein